MNRLFTSSLLFFATLQIAHATPARRMLMNTQVGTPPAEAQKIVNALVAKLTLSTQLHGEALGKALETKLTADAGPVNEADHWRKEIALGRSRFIEGNYPGAIAKLEEARQALWQRQALMARNQGLREPLHQALLFLAHTYLRTQKNARAIEIIGEAVRSFPDHHPALAKYAPELVQLYKRVSRDLNQKRKATLEIITDEEGCLAFVNGRYAGITPTKVPDMLPGRYAVYVQKPGRRGRIHRVQMAGSNNRLRIDFSLDSALVTRGAVGLHYATLAMAQRYEAEHASLLAQTVQADEVILVGYRAYHGRKALSGRVVAAATGRTVRSGMLTLDPAPPT
ncbi:MAG: PEGA domain-containing protein, partial [Deltaproteobacteria bacterium]|nr:PEGA domain-containing protein [Deltaproteobacteria bacterium]